MATELMERKQQGRGGLRLRPGPRWPSLEKLRTSGARRLEAELAEGHVGHLRVKNTDFVVLRAETFDEIYSLAQDVHRLQRGLRLVRQAVQLLFQTKSQESNALALQHLYDLSIQLPELDAETPPGEPLVFDDEDLLDGAPGGDSAEDFDPARIERPTFTAAR